MKNKCLVLVIRERRHLGHNKATLRCDNEPAIEELAREIAQAHQEGSQTVGKPVQWDHRTCSGTRGQPGQNTERCAGASREDQNPVPQGCCAGWLKLLHT